MRILKTAAAIIIGSYTEVSLVVFAPRTWQICDWQITIEERTLELESNDDVKIVGYFICLDANETRLYAIDAAVELLH